MTTILWLRNDLRLSDHPALQAAITRGQPVVPVFIWSPDEESPWQPGAASRWWLHQSLGQLDRELRRLGSRLIIRQGPVLETMTKLIVETGANAVFWSRRYEPIVIERDRKLKDSFKKNGIQAESFNSSLLFEPWTIHTQKDQPFQVFTPFWKNCLANSPERIEQPLPAPKAVISPTTWPESTQLEDLNLLPRIDWAAGFRESWQPGEHGAQLLWQRFSNSIAPYKEDRNRPDLPATSKLSPHLHFGEISVRELWWKLKELPESAGKTHYLSELGWREFAHHLLYHFPHTTDQPLRSQYAKFPWRDDAKQLRDWQRGRTGYPIVDAGMRELWHTGWMHNRVRMIVASFLVKDLLISWQDGAKWFWDTLVDADLASNTLGWQWTAGCGADAAPYFRIFNPISQGEKFDPNGDYVRRWIPELADLPSDLIHQPWNAGPLIRSSKYPRPMIQHDDARKEALAALASLKDQS